MVPRRMAFEMPRPSQVVITSVSGISSVTVTGGNLGSSANEPNVVVPTGNGTSQERAKRSHLRVVRN